MAFTAKVGLSSEDQIRRFCDAVQAPVSINMGFGIRSRPTTPLMSVKRLAELGVKRVSFARMLPAAAIMAMRQALEVLLDSVRTGTIHDRPDLLASIEDITDLMGYDHINALEAKFGLPEDILARYKSDKPDYVKRDGHANK